MRITNPYFELLCANYERVASDSQLSDRQTFAVFVSSNSLFLAEKS